MFDQMFRAKFNDKVFKNGDLTYILINRTIIKYFNPKVLESQFRVDGLQKGKF